MSVPPIPAGTCRRAGTQHSFRRCTPITAILDGNSPHTNNVWLGRQDSNQGMAESKSDLTTYLRAEAQRRTAARLGNISMVAVTRRQGTWTMLTPVIPVISCTIIVHGCQRAYAAYSLVWVPL